MLDNLQIAKLAYKEIKQAILEIQDSHNIYCSIPTWIEVNGEVFHIYHLEEK